MLRVTINQVNPGKEGLGLVSRLDERGFQTWFCFSRAGDGTAAKVEFDYTCERVVASRTCGFHDPNEISGLQLFVRLCGPLRAAIQIRYVLFQPPGPDGVRVCLRACISLAVVEITVRMRR